MIPSQSVISSSSKMSEKLKIRVPQGVYGSRFRDLFWSWPRKGTCDMAAQAESLHRAAADVLRRSCRGEGTRQVLYSVNVPPV